MTSAATETATSPTQPPAHTTAHHHHPHHRAHSIPLSHRLAAWLCLRHAEDLRTIAFTAIYFVLFATLWTTCAHPLSYGLASLLLWCITCYFSFIGAVATHNCIHCPMFTHQPYNKAFQIVLSLVYGHPVTSYIPGHNLSHHKYTQDARDVIRTTKVQFRWHLLNGLLFFFVVGKDIVKNDNEYFRIQSLLHRPVVKQLHIEQVVLYAVTAVLLITSPSRWLWFAFLPHAYAKFCIVSMNMLQHDGCDMRDTYNSSRNFTGEWLNFFCYNNGYHTIHHMYPGLHWSILPDKHRALVVPHIDPRLDEQYILSYIWRTFVYPGVRTNYLGEPWDSSWPGNGDTGVDIPWAFEQSETYSTNDKQ